MAYSQLAFSFVNDTVVVYLNGKSYRATSTHPNFEKIKAAIAKSDADSLPELSTYRKRFRNTSSERTTSRRGQGRLLSRPNVQSLVSQRVQDGQAPAGVDRSTAASGACRSIH